ncbi:MAG: hypothetical protein KF764_12675 [Labilithrix sp.]|nr:hypothetical protein [Labilithrix sp.]MBX3223220.1 hypothetical protein [Labilithrix sp.]
MFRRHHAIVATLCLPTIGLLSAGCDDDEKATPQIIFDGRLERGTGNDCKDVGGLFEIGSFGNQALEEKQASRPIKDGEAFDQGTVSVSCSVTSAGGDEFNVVGSVGLSGATGGLFRIDGKFKATGEQTGIHAIFSSRKSANTYEQLDRACIVRYTTAFQGVAAGRVWGEITCPKAENTGAQTSCAAIAQFRFENCGQ